MIRDKHKANAAKRMITCSKICMVAYAFMGVPVVAIFSLLLWIKARQLMGSLTADRGALSGTKFERWEA